MTSFGNFFKPLMGDKFKNMNYILLINLIAIVVSALWQLINGNFDNNTFFQFTVSWSSLALLVSFVRLAVLHERIYTRDSYRLIPVGDIKFYLTNLLTSFISLIYVGAVELVAYGLTASFNWQEYMDNIQMFFMMTGQAGIETSKLIWTSVAFIIMMMSIAILTWSTISLIHLLTRVGSSFLPGTRSKVINFIVYVVVIVVVIKIVSWMMEMLSHSATMLSNSSDIWAFTLNVVAILVLAALEVALNIYLMGHWVETVSES